MSGEHEIGSTDELSAEERHEMIAAMRPEDAERVPELHEVEVPDELREQIEEAVGRYPRLRSASIPALWAVQRHYGWCTPEGIREAAAVMGLTPAYLQSVASFYDLFSTAPASRHRVLVCHNISCWMNGADELLDAFRAAAAGEDVDVRGFECLGACDVAPMASIDERYYGPLDAADALAAIEQLRDGAEMLPGKAVARRAAAGGPEPEPDPRIAEVER
ncbi:MAG: NAD(P)H-dependent oxidoreductase subunit E [Solirubrobacterales bacterium]